MLSAAAEREGEQERSGAVEGRWDGSQSGVNDSPCFLKRGVVFSKARQLDEDLFCCARATAVT